MDPSSPSSATPRSHGQPSGGTNVRDKTASSGSKMIRWLKKTLGIPRQTNELAGTRRRQATKAKRPTRRDSSPIPARVSWTGDARLEQPAKSPSRRLRGRRSPKFYTEGATLPTTAVAQRMPLLDYHFRSDHDTFPPPHVLIIGGGIGGLCLANGLKNSGIPFTVFEQDAKPDARRQGYRLHINSAGYEALKAVLTRDVFEVFLRATGHFFPSVEFVDAVSGASVSSSSSKRAGSGQVFSIERAMLRMVLLMDLKNGTEIQYGKRFQRYEVLPHGNVQVHFDTGETVQGTVVIGADGTTSRVRQQYIPQHATLLDADSGAIYGKTRITREIETYFETSSTTIVTSSQPGISLVIEPRCHPPIRLNEFTKQSSQDPDGLSRAHKYLSWTLIARTQQLHGSGSSFQKDPQLMTGKQLAWLALAMTSSWCPRVRHLLEYQAPEWTSFMRISTMSPTIHAWQPSSRVTLLGDAIHTMAPAGIASNAALQDAMQLTALFRDVGVNEHAIARYERDMRRRSREAIAACIEAGKRTYDLPDPKDMLAAVGS